MVASMSYVTLLNDVLKELLHDEKVMLIGQGVTSPWYAGGATKGLEGNIIDTPVSEDAITGVAAGAALAGMRPILFFARMDFMWLAMNQIVNTISMWPWMYGLEMPVTIWAVINRGGGQGAQHSQAIHATLAHVPGLRILAPSNGIDAYDFMRASVEDSRPTIYIDDRWLYRNAGLPAPRPSLTVDKIHPEVLRKGADVTLVSMSHATTLAMRAAASLEGEVSVEVIDLCKVKPLEWVTICESVRKTRRLLVVDAGWRHYGLSAEVIAMVSETMPYKVDVMRLALCDAHAPASAMLEEAYYIDSDVIIQFIRRLME